jgi:hypothetical protein
LAACSPDACGPPFGDETNWRASAIESRLVDAAQGIVADALNDSAAQQAPKDRASAALQRLEDESARINAAWPVENRFHFELLDIAPALVAKMGGRTHERFFLESLKELRERRSLPGERARARRTGRRPRLSLRRGEA